MYYLATWVTIRTTTLSRHTSRLEAQIAYLLTCIYKLLSTPPCPQFSTLWSYGAFTWSLGTRENNISELKNTHEHLLKSEQQLGKSDESGQLVFGPYQLI